MAIITSGEPTAIGAGYKRLRQAIQVAYFTDGHNSKSECRVVRSYPCESVRYILFWSHLRDSRCRFPEIQFPECISVAQTRSSERVVNQFLIILPANQFDVATAGPGAIRRVPLQLVMISPSVK